MAGRRAVSGHGSVARTTEGELGAGGLTEKFSFPPRGEGKRQNPSGELPHPNQITELDGHNYRFYVEAFWTCTIAGAVLFSIGFLMLALAQRHSQIRS